MYGSPPAAPKDLNRPLPQATHHQHQMSSGLLRYRSAPSSLLGEVCDDFPPDRPSSPETETMFARFLTPDLRVNIRSNPPQSAAGAGGQRNSQFPPPSPQPPTAVSAAAAAASQMVYPRHHRQNQTASSSMAMEADLLKKGGGGGPNLVRHSSSPAGLLSHLSLENGYGVMRGIAGFRNGLMSQISETENESIVVGGGGGGGGGYNPMASWEESPILSANNFSSSGLKRPRDDQTEHQNGEVRSGLSHKFSPPKTSSEMAAIEKFLQFQDSVPCRIRAKRGCATHPRSIAERVRRTRISERMRKLQELVPNMDKQTNTADMLDLAVDYIKDLQKHVKTLSDGRASCTCSSRSRSHTQTLHRE